MQRYKHKVSRIKEFLSPTINRTSLFKNNGGSTFSSTAVVGTFQILTMINNQLYVYTGVFNKQINQNIGNSLKNLCLTKSFGKLFKVGLNMSSVKKKTT